MRPVGRCFFSPLDGDTIEPNGVEITFFKNQQQKMMVTFSIGTVFRHPAVSGI